MTKRNVTPVFDDRDNVFTISGANGKDEGLEFICSLDKRAQARFQFMLRKLSDGHHLKSPEHMRHLSSNDPEHRGAHVHELKVSLGPGWRLYVVQWNGSWYVTHGLRKPKDNKVPQQIARAFETFHVDL